MKWQVNLEVRDSSSAMRNGSHCFSFTVESKSPSMALEKAVQQAIRSGLQTIGVCSCNPVPAGSLA